MNIHKICNIVNSKSNNLINIAKTNKSNSNLLSKLSTNKISKTKAVGYATILATMLSLTSCFSDNKVKKDEVIEGIKIEYANVKPDTQKAISDALIDFNKIADSDFLNDVNICVVDDYQNLIPDNSFKDYIKQNKIDNRGCSFYSDSTLPRRIMIQETGHSTARISGFLKGNGASAYKYVRQTLMHEIGHQFDSYYGHNHNADYAKRMDSMLYAQEKDSTLSPYYLTLNTKADTLTLIQYGRNDGLSDKKEFKEAMLKDLKEIAKLKTVSSNKLADNIDYYISDIDFTRELNFDVIDINEFSRSEVYAQLFSYAIGEDDGNKAKFVDNFINSFKVVQKDINKNIKK